METFSHLWQFLTEFFLEWEIFQSKVVEKIKTHILCSTTFPRKCAVCEIVSKNMVVPETSGNTSHGRCILVMRTLPLLFYICMKVCVSGWGRITGWGYSRIGCWERFLGWREMHSELYHFPLRQIFIGLSKSKRTRLAGHWLKWEGGGKK